MEKRKKLIRKMKKQVKRNNTYSISSNDNSFTNLSRSSNKPNNRTKWNIYKSWRRSSKK